MFYKHIGETQKYCVLEWPDYCNLGQIGKHLALLSMFRKCAAMKVKVQF